MNPSSLDVKMMRRCIELAATAVQQRELPFSCVICYGDEVVAEAVNHVVRDNDVTRHAELLAISQAQRALGKRNLSGCTLYSIVEPCAMCSFPIREARIGRVVFSISSPMMGGISKWNVLADNEISNVMPEAFADAPEVSGGLLFREAAAVWRHWNPVIWTAIRYRGCLSETRADEAHRILQRRPRRRYRLLRRLFALHR